jgi:hypothetical protein
MAEEAKVMVEDATPKKKAFMNLLMKKELKKMSKN